ncbi:Mername-AA217 hypothetical peptidase (M14 family) [Schistosoma mansoni]|uniref:Mername-AA217 hypothetical peptidase (M14 family) n=1 Tax=Schistosoma mansoni TaxID=6183 RepID=UPI0001A636B7|nr:Mername-AA217 hypothetical peptidase (M14 family) [Schistosoma mansoni]|eukprot:XP_018646620.1 Mername-AA217 hypothetical peptidase (M14 family) [Schistosoma mansoni]
MLIQKGITRALFQALYTEYSEETPNVELLLKIHQLLCRLGPMDKRFGIRARLSHCIPITIHLLRIQVALLNSSIRKTPSRFDKHLKNLSDFNFCYPSMNLDSFQSNAKHIHTISEMLHNHHHHHDATMPTVSSVIRRNLNIILHMICLYASNGGKTNSYLLGRNGVMKLLIQLIALLSGLHIYWKSSTMNSLLSPSTTSTTPLTIRKTTVSPTDIPGHHSMNEYRNHLYNNSQLSSPTLRTSDDNTNENELIINSPVRYIVIVMASMKALLKYLYQNENDTFLNDQAESTKLHNHVITKLVSLNNPNIINSIRSFITSKPTLIAIGVKHNVKLLRLLVNTLNCLIKYNAAKFKLSPQISYSTNINPVSYLTKKSHETPLSHKSSTTNNIIKFTINRKSLSKQINPISSDYFKLLCNTTTINSNNHHHYPKVTQKKLTDERKQSIRIQNKRITSKLNSSMVRASLSKGVPKITNLNSKDPHSKSITDLYTINQAYNPSIDTFLHPPLSKQFNKLFISQSCTELPNTQQLNKFCRIQKVKILRRGEDESSNQPEMEQDFNYAKKDKLPVICDQPTSYQLLSSSNTSLASPEEIPNRLMKEQVEKPLDMNSVNWPYESDVSIHPMEPLPQTKSVVHHLNKLSKSVKLNKTMNQSLKNDQSLHIPSNISDFPHTEILDDMRRFIDSNDLINRIVYDLDGLIKFQSNDDPIKMIGQFDVEKGHLEFESRFECGNLRKAIQVRQYEYDLILNPDINTTSYIQWFYFRISNMESNISYRFNIINCEKVDSQFNAGMQPLLFSVHESLQSHPCWKRVGSNIIYYRNHFTRHLTRKCNVDSGTYYTATFTIRFPYTGDICYLAYHYPYTYTRLLTDLNKWQYKMLNHSNEIYFRIQQLTSTILSNPVPLITITQIPDSSDESININQRPYIILTCRVHPGESNSSWIIKGLIEQLLSNDDRKMNELRKMFIFKIIPMLNPDGVIVGNHRCSMSGKDLNRHWINPSSLIHPTIYHTKMLMEFLTLCERSPYILTCHACTYEKHLCIVRRLILLLIQKSPKYESNRLL